MKNDHLCRVKLRLFFGMLALVGLIGLAGGSATADGGKQPFQPGEKLTFELRWEFIPAGKATLEVHRPVTIDGEPAHHFVLTAETNNFVDVFYKVRQRIDAYTDIGVTRSLGYREVHTVHKTRRDATIKFDWDNLQAQWINFGKAEPAIPIQPGSFDPLTAFYYSRTLDPTVQKQIAGPITDGKKCKVGVASVIRRETISVLGKTYDTYLVEPEIQDLGGVFKKSPNAKIQLWVTADERRIPVRIKSKVVVGSFTGELVSIETIPVGDSVAAQ